jgi:hypothetical protein
MAGSLSPGVCPRYVPPIPQTKKAKPAPVKPVSGMGRKEGRKKTKSLRKRARLWLVVVVDSKKG